MLRIFAKNNSVQPLQTIALSDIFVGGIFDGDAAEIDLEGAAEIDGTLFWIGSHSTSRKGKGRPARQRLLALTLKKDAQGSYIAQAKGAIVTDLMDALIKDARFKPYRLKKARCIPPKSIGGLSIEGLSATPSKSLLIRFRNPLKGGKIKHNRLINGKALIIELLNSFAVINGLAPVFADPFELDLHGLSIRDISWRKKQKYLIVAGPYHDNVATPKHPRIQTQLFSWSKKSGKLKHLKKINLHDLNIEAAIFYPDQNDIVQLLSDDGQLDNLAGFRSITLKL